MRKNILFITESYHYAPSPNGNCVEKVARELVHQGDNVTVLTLKNQETKNNFECIDGVKVFRVNTYAEWKVLFGYFGINMISRSVSKIFKLLKNIFIPLHPFRSPGVLLNLYILGKRIIIDEQIDTIIAVYRDFETAMSGALLAKKYPRVWTMLYSLDAISGGVCSNQFVSEKTHIKKCQKWEKYFMDTFDVFCPMKSHRAVYDTTLYNKYRNKIKYLDIPNLLSDDYNYSINQDSTVNFVFTGMLTESNADCCFFLKILKKYIETENAIFNIYGSISNGIKNTIKEMNLWNRTVFFHGRIAQEELINVRNQATVFLNFGNEHSCGIPCKIFEYMSTGKMILSFSKIKEDANTPYLEKYGNALILMEDDQQIEQYVKRINEFISQNKECQISKKDINKMFYANTPKAFSDVIHMDN